MLATDYPARDMYMMMYMMMTGPSPAGVEWEL